MEKPWRNERSQRRRKTPSFSSSLLEAIYHSIDESVEEKETSSFAAAAAYRRNNNGGGVEVEEEITSLRRAIMLEKWMESYTRRHFNSDSSSSTDSSLFSSSETESSAASRSTPKSSIFTAKSSEREKTAAAASSATLCAGEVNQKREGRFMRTKSRALKIYGDLKKVKQPISPGGKIANFLNSIFNSSRSSNSLKKHPAEAIEDWSSVTKSRSVKDSTMASRSCLNKTPSRAKSKRSVRFCPVSVILDEDCQPCGHKNTYENDKNPMPYIPTHYINHSFRDSREIYSSDDDDEDVRSCTSSDLFELENVGSFSRVLDATAAAAAADELPVYGTTSLKLNQAIANGLRS
ncbi:PREDICTED: protein BIG GRAIN 1-like A [Ipomoea nil]|uniref:protein BIG GRAIN 1-like A n=1 Tax=Ipomoea nil TaxID=35883 RepID=UPI0009018B18|nr:PREDICTED: protein BIG GRAIN 1-like A [Ipomoea nil]